ncbi:MAG: hypothetical protein HOG03_11640 [Desulfobacula sp.]|jgi:DNA repair protein RadC|uniref:JAB domain-containing protein n=2 Tax=Desulfobacula sp. TaxID=2593537 RepID=UPI001DA6B694|nr:hypothetical protein [Desulfobacula sp.]MBT3805236.1 hypothetical protein [Desulfobacula sp.]MBT4024569.1 hypothetical protein [Desulfobacula sp.]MBT4199885.1 hypothetical protein [Desulfobacula sp.]MBT4507478.1 hypothetical protein [Desulfobacula sp.]
MAALSDRTIRYYHDLINDNPERDRTALVEGIKHFHRKGNETQFYPTVNKLEYEGRKKMDLQEEQVREKKDSEPGDIMTGLKRGVQTSQAMLYGSTALVGRAMEGAGMDNAGAATKEWGLKGYQRNMAESEKYKAKYSFKDVYTGKTGFGGAIDWAQGTLGELAPSMAEAAVGTLIGTLAAPGAGTAIGAFGARTLLKKSINKLTKEAIESGVKGVTESQLKKQITGQALKKLGGRIGMGAAVMPLETGGMYAGLLEEHGVDAPFTALLFGAAATSLEFFGGNSRLIDNLVGAIGKGQSGLIKRTAKEILKGVPEEAFQEGAQEIMSILNTVVNTDEKLLTVKNFESIVESAAAGAVGGGAGAVVSGVLSKGSKDKGTDKEDGDDTKGPSDAEKILMDEEDLGKSAEDFLKDDIMEHEDDVRAASEFTDEELDQVISKPDDADIAKKEEKPSEKISSGQTVSWVNSSGKIITGTVDSLGANAASVNGKDGKKYRIGVDKFNIQDAKDQGETLLKDDVPETDFTNKTEPGKINAVKKAISKTENGDPQVEKTPLEQKEISLSPDQGENKLPDEFSPGKTVSWETKKGKEIFATLVRRDKNDRWHVEKSDGKKAIVAQKILTISDNLINSDKKAPIDARLPQMPNSKEESEPWEMSQKEWTDGHIKSPAMHKDHVKKAIQDGKIKSHLDYPELTVKESQISGQKDKPESIKTPERKPGIKGGNGKAFLNDNSEIEFVYEIIDSKDLVTSHDDNMAVNPEFPAELQPRERSRKASLMQVESMAAKLNPERLGSSSSVSQGAPIVGGLNIVESGNGRVLAIRKAYSGKSGKQYKNWLISKAMDFGVTDPALNKIKNPVLVRRRTTKIDDLAKFTQKANEADTAKLSSTEQAVVDGGNLTSDDLSTFRPSQDGDLTAATNKVFIDRFLGKMSPEEQSGYLTEDGRANKQLVDRMQASIFQKAYGSDELLKMAAEEADPDIKNILNGMTAAATEFAKAKGLDEEIADQVIIDDLIKGILYLRQAQKEYPNLKSSKGGTKAQAQLSQALAQQDMFNSEISEDVKQISSFLAENIRSGKRIGEFISALGNYLRKGISDLKQMDIFEKKEGLSSSILISKALKKLEKKYEDKQRNLFSQQIIREPEKPFYGTDHEAGNGQGKQERYSRRTSSEDAKETQVKEPTSEAPKQLDLFEYQAAQLPKIRITGKLRTKQEVSTTFAGRVDIAETGYIIQSPQDAATFLSHLVVEPHENAYFLSLDEDGKVLEVIRHAIGVKGSSPIDSISAIGRSFNLGGVKRIVFLHNHPSNKTEPSPSDKNIIIQLSDIAALRKIDIIPMIIGNMEFATFDKYGNTSAPTPIKDTVSKIDVPIRERIFTKRVKRTDPVFQGHDDAVKRFKDEEDGFLLLNSSNQEVGFLPFPSGLEQREITARLLAAIEKTNATSILINNKPPANATGREDFFERLSDALLDNGVSLFDIFSYTKTGHVKNNPQDIRRDPYFSMEQMNRSGIQFSTVSYDELTAAQKKLYNKRLKELPEEVSVQIQSNIKKFKGTSWEKQATAGLLVRQGINDLLSGKDTNDENLKKSSIVKEIKKNGEEGIWNYIISKPSGMIGHPVKPVNSINSSFSNCNPSKACAKFCYATKGHYVYASNIISGEVTNWAIEKDPVRAANIAANHYTVMLDFKLKKALRLLDKGDLGLNWIPFIKQLNIRGIRVQVFSKRPELLSQVPKQNLRLLSIDETNHKLADQNPELQVAYAYDGSQKSIDWLVSHKDQIQLILPVKIGRKVLNEEKLKALPAWAKRRCCPVNSGAKKIKSKDNIAGWTCAQCDKDGGIGCFRGQSTATVMAAEAPLTIEGANKYGKEIRQLADRLPEESRQAFFEDLDVLLSQVREGINPESEERYQGQAGQISQQQVIPKFQSDQTPGQGVTLKDIQSVFKGQDVFISPDNSISIRLKNGHGVHILNATQMSEGVTQYAIESGRMDENGIILGTTVGDTITLNQDYADKKTLNHETYHVLTNLGMITESDRMVLNGKLNSFNKKGRLNFKFSKHADKIIAKEENEANLISQFLAEREQFRGTAFGRVLQKIADFLDGLLHIGRMSATKLAREVESGKIFKREGLQGESKKSKLQTSDDFNKEPGSKVSKITARFNKKGAGYESDQFKDILPKSVAKAMQKGRGIKKSTLLEKFRNFKTDMKMEMDHFPELTRMEPGKQRSSAREILRRHQDISNIVQDKAARKMSGMLNNLDKREYDMFAMELILGDEVRSINDGLRTDYNLPWGFESMDQVIESHKKIQNINRKNKTVAKAIEDRRKFHKGLARDLVKYGVMKKEILKSGDYFHHQILLYWNEKAAEHHKGMGTSSSEIRTKWRPWMTARKGSPLEYNTEYMEAEYIATSQQMALIETAKNLAQIKKENDILRDLKQQAKAENKAIYDKWVALQTKNNFNFEDPAKPHVIKIAMGFSNLVQAVKTGEITYDSEFQDVVDAILIAGQERKINKEAWMEAVDDNPRAGLAINHPRLFPFLSHLLEKQHQGSMYAAMIYKGIKGRDRVVKEVLGKSFKTWKQIIPKGYKEWKPDPKKGAFFVNSITDQVLQNVLAGEKTLEDKDVRKVLARGNPPIWILPEGLADTMDNLKPHNTEGRLARTSEVAMAAWKQYILLNPFSALKYNINNMSGDLDIVLAYRPEIANPNALKKSLGDLINWSRYKKLNPQLKIELEEAQKYGVIGSGFAVQEVTDTMKIMTTNTFVKDILTEEKLGLAASYWKHVKNASQTRENILRLAAFRWFKKQLESGISIYGVSKIDDINNLVDQGKTIEAAAKLARELLGDYGNISRHGEFIRRRMIPFYSWMEINAPRYVYLMKNLKYEGETTNRLSFTFARRGVVFVAKASMLAGAVMIFNTLMFPDELEELGPEKRRQMHLILGRREDGSIITLKFQGALSDALSWFAKEDLPSDIKDLMQGKSTIQEQLMDIPKAVLNKTVSSIRPDVKMLFETLTGSSTYPDATSPKPIRDKVENILKTFKLDIFYRKAMGRPGRGKDMAEHFLSDLLNLITYTTEPGVQAYYDTRKLVFTWKEKNGFESGGGKPTKKGNAFYYYRQALKYGDLVSAKKYLQKYYDLGGTAKGKKSAIRLAHPLAGIKKMDRYEFKKTLLPAEKKRLEHAIKWYIKTYVEKGRGVSN